MKVSIWINLIYAICFCMSTKGSNKLSGPIPSEIGRIKSLSNFSLGKKSSNIYLYMYIYIYFNKFICSMFFLHCVTFIFYFKVEIV